MDNWEDYRKAANSGPWPISIKIIGLIVALVVIIGIIFFVLSWTGEGAKVAKNEFGPEALLEKYEWFKDASAQLDKKLADIQVYDSRMRSMEESYKNIERQKWPREDREQYNVWSSEVAGTIASYNSLAAEYNAQMAKFNWRFTNVGDLPKGATITLPREYREYKTGGI